MEANIFENFTLEVKGDYVFKLMNFVKVSNTNTHKFALYRKEDFYATVKIKIDTLKIETIYQVDINEKEI